MTRMLAQRPTTQTTITLRRDSANRLPASASPRQRAEAVIRNIWAEGTTWRNRSNLWQRFQESFRLNPQQSLDWAVTTFVEETATQPSGRLQYAKDLSAMLSRMGHQVPVCRMYMAGLRTSGALEPTDQAHPISAQQVLQAMGAADAQRLAPLKAGIFLAYKSAARWSDINRLQRKNIFGLKPTSLTIHWGDATKTTAAEPFAVRGLTVVEHPAGMHWLVDYLAQLTPEQFICPWPTDKVTRWMLAYVPQDTDPQKAVTASSIKRGAVTFLVVQASRGLVSPELISRVAKHKHWFEEISATTIRYVGREVWDELAHVLRTQEATRLLLA